MLIHPDVIDYFTNEAVLAKINAKIDTANANKYYAKAYPTTMVMTPEGVEIDRIVGYEEPEDFLQTLRDYQNGIGTLEDLLSRVDSSEDRQLDWEIANKYRWRGDFENAPTWFDKVIAGGEPADSLTIESRKAMADMLRRDKQYDAAIEAFRAIATDFAGTPHEENADIYVAYILALKSDTVAAIDAYSAFLEKYPLSEDTAWVAEQIELLQNPSTDEETE